MASNKKSVKNFIAMWDNQGLECIFDVDAEMAQRDAYEKRKLWNILKDEKMLEYRPSIPLQSMILRAKYNSQRHYEIYQFVTDGLDMDDVKSMFEDSPQFIVNHIRKNGKKIYSDRLEQHRVVIT
jgi:hypothetical protein